jgi:5-formyltetrahydrofolate cyclo-ligase
VVLVPGLAFDERGHRLGYGGGVYDRMLVKTPRAKHIGLFFAQQRLNKIPIETHDKPLHRIITENEN